MDVVWLILKLLLAAFAVYVVASQLYSNRNRLGFIWAVWKRFRFLMLLEVVVVIFLTACTVVLMWEYTPWLRFGWLNIFIESGGNMLVAPVVDGSSSPNVLVRILPPIFFLAFLVVVPFLAHYEEIAFRQGHYRWGAIVRQSIKFGLIHLVVGIPILAAFALIGVGFFFACKYRSAWLRAVHDARTENVEQAEHEAVMVSTAYHTLYNSLLILVILWVTTNAI